MKDPYSVLGVSAYADDEDIKKAYRELVRKYHPDNYHDNPLEDLAEEKMKEINEAYDAINAERSAGYSSSTYGSSRARYGYTRQDSGQSARQNSSTSNNVYLRVRQAINSGDLATADRLLTTNQTRAAQWNFLMGSLCYRKGWLDEARRYYLAAVKMDPGNMEYRQAASYMDMQGSFYRPARPGMTSNDACSCCSTLIAADCCCECLGGDLISCC